MEEAAIAGGLLEVALLRAAAGQVARPHALPQALCPLLQVHLVAPLHSTLHVESTRLADHAQTCLERNAVHGG